MLKDINFINGLVKSREKYLVSKDEFIRMADAENAAEAFKILREHGFGGDISGEIGAEDYETAIAAEWALYVDFLKEYSPSKNFFSLASAKNDFFNAECAVRAKQLDIDEDMFMPFGSVEKEAFVKAVGGKFDALPDYLVKPMQEAIKLFEEGEPTGAEVGIFFLRAYYAFMLKTVKNKIWKENIVFEIDAKNIATAMRSESSKKAADFYIDGGKIRKDVLALIADKNEKKALDKLLRTPYYDLTKEGFEGLKSGGLVAFERDVDDFSAKKLKEKRFETEGVVPSLVYYFYKTSAIKNARLVMAMKLAGADKEMIKSRLRECYAK